MEILIVVISLSLFPQNPSTDTELRLGRLKPLQRLEIGINYDQLTSLKLIATSISISIIRAHFHTLCITCGSESIDGYLRNQIAPLIIARGFDWKIENKWAINFESSTNIKILLMFMHMQNIPLTNSAQTCFLINMQEFCAFSHFASSYENYVFTFIVLNNKSLFTCLGKLFNKTFFSLLRNNKNGKLFHNFSRILIFMSVY